MDRDNAAADGSKGGKIKKGRVLDPDRCLTDVLELTLPSKKKLVKKNAKRDIVVEYARDSETGKRVISNPRRSRKKQKSQLENNENITTSFPDYQLSMEIDIEGSHKDAEHILENNEKNLKDMISECEKLTLSHKDKSESSKWTDRLEKASAMWEKHRNYIAECALEIESFGGSLNVCENCSVKNPEIRCLDCADSKFLCISCDKLIHERFPLHDRDGWVDGFYKPLLPTETKDAASANIIHIDRRPVLHSTKCPKCESSELECQIVDEDCIIVTVKGRFDLKKYFMLCKSCHHEWDPFNLKTLIKFRLWPGSPEACTYLFDQDVFRLWNSFSKRMPGSSESAFLSSLNDISAERGRLKEIHSQTFTKAFKEWKYLNHELEQLQQKNWMICPPCAISQHSCHVDGNCKLYRYKNAGRKRNENYYKNAFIEENDSVLEFLNETYQYRGGVNAKESSDKDCGSSSWKAASNIGHKRSTLDETGLDIVSCRHSIGQRAVNMFQGELYGYALFLQKNFLLPKNVEFFFCDVVCKYWPWVLKVAPEVAGKMKPALSIMHAKGHAPSCQVLWDGEWQTGAGRSTGEETEQVNGYLSRTGSTTKHMLPENREEALTEFMMAWNKRKILKLPKDLCTRYLKTHKELLIVSEKIENALEEMSISKTDANVHSWIEEIKLLASVDHSVETDATLSEKAEYILLAAMSKEDQQVQVLPELQHLPVPLITKLRFEDIPPSKTGRVSRLAQLSEKYHSFDDSFHTAHGELIMCITDMVKRQIEKMCYNMSHYSFLIKKIADRSKWRHVLRKLISKEKATLSLFIDAYESCLQLNDPGSIMTEEMKEAIVAGNFPWSRVHELSGNVDIADKRLIVQWWLVRDRLSEEKNIIIKEMHSYLSYYKDVVMPNLDKEQRDISEGLWNCLGSDSNKDNHQEDNKMRYQPADLRKDVLSGIHAVLSRGRAFAAQKISDGMFWFKKIFAEVSSCSEGPIENLPSSFTREIKLLSRQYFSEESSDSETDNDFIHENEDDTYNDDQFISNDSNIDSD